MRALALVLLVACRGQEREASSAPTTGSASGRAPLPADATPTRTFICAPPAANVTLAVHDDQPAACWDKTCVEDGELVAAVRPSAMLHPTEVRMNRGVLSVCKDGCTPMRERLAERIAKTDPAKVWVSEDLLFLVTDATAWRLQFDSELTFTPLPKQDPTVVPSRVQIVGELFLATIEGHGQLYNLAGLPKNQTLSDWNPGDVVELAPKVFLVIDRDRPRFGALDARLACLLWEQDAFAAFEIHDAIRVRDGIGAVLMHHEDGWWIATVQATDRAIVALAHVPICR